MAVKTSAELKTQIDTIIKVNGNREITPPKHNSILTNVIDSYLNKSDGGVLSAMLEYSYNPSFTTDYQIIHKKYVDDAISGLTTGLTYQGTWDANTNTPTIASGIGTNGYYYIVNVAGTTNIDGVNDWEVGDWILFNGTTWQKIDQSTKWSDGFPTYDLRYQGLAANLTSLSGLSYASTSFVKMTAAGTFALDTNTYANISGLTTNYIPKWDGSAFVDSEQKYASISESTGLGTIQGIVNERNSIVDILSSTSSGFRLFNGNTMLFAINRPSPSYIQFSTFGAIGIRIGSYNSNQNIEFMSANTTKTYFYGSTGNWDIQGTANVNKIILNGGIKIANNTDTAASAGAGSIKYDSGLQISDASNWEKALTSPTSNVKVTAAAPYTNDGYIEVRINGTLIKLMTTA